MSEKPKVLLVDDVHDNLVALEALLTPLDVDTVCAGSGYQALKALLADEFAVILLDAKMPGMDGFETATLIKSRDKTKNVPLVFITADIIPEYAQRGYAIGAVDCLTKPLNPDRLYALLRTWLDR